MRRLPRWLRILLVAIALVVAAGLILPYFLDANRYRTLIATVIESKTGRKVRIGKIQARLLPSVGFVMEDFGLSNPPGFAEGDVLAVETIRGNLAWGPLLHREFRLSSVELVRPKFMLLEDDRGQTNYGPRDTSGPTPQANQKSAERSRSAEPSAEVAEVDRIEMTDAEVVLARLAPRARNDRALVPSVHARKIRAELSGVVLEPLRPKQWQGEANLAGVLLELPGWKSPIGFRSGRLELRNGRIQSEFRISLGQAAEFKGTLRVADIEHGVANFELNTPQLDVDQLLALRAETSRGARAYPGRSELLAQGRLAAEQIRWQPYATSHGAAEVRVFTDRVELWPFTVELYGGTLQISARADRTQTPERFSANVQVRNLNLGTMLAASPTARGKLSGTGELNLQLFGALSDDWRKSLSGTGNFAIRDGRLPGINLAGVLESVAKLAGMGGETPFSLIQGDFTIGHGRVWSRLLHMDSPRGTVDLHGSCDLDGALDYDGQVVLVPAASATGGQSPAEAIGAILGGVLKRDVGRVTVPISIRGTLYDPKIHPGRGVPVVERPSPAPQPGQTPPQKSKSILDIFRRP